MLLPIAMIRTSSLDSLSTEADVFYVEHSSKEDTPAGNKTPVVLNSSQILESLAREAITISSVASPVVIIESDSNEPTVPYRFGNQHPIVQPSLNDPNLPPDPLIILATKAVIEADPPQRDED